MGSYNAQWLVGTKVNEDGSIDVFFLQAGDAPALLPRKLRTYFQKDSGFVESLGAGGWVGATLQTANQFSLMERFSLALNEVGNPPHHGCDSTVEPQKPTSREVDTCPFRKSYPDVLVVQSSQDRNGDNGARALDCSTKKAHLSVMPSACVLDCNTPHKRKGNHVLIQGQGNCYR